MAMNRRQFGAVCAGVVGGALVGGVREGEGQSFPRPPANVKVGAGKAVLAPSDFTYLGHYSLDFGGEFSLGQGLAHRYVGGQLRFLALTHAVGAMSYELVEFAPPPSLGGTVSSAVGWWADPWVGLRGSGNGCFHGLWWDDAGDRLWTTAAIDYPDDTQRLETRAIAVTTLGTAGKVGAVRGLFGLQGVGTRAIYGGFSRVPAWFQERFSVPPYVVGFGGYTSRMAQDLMPSMGPSLFALADPTGLADGAIFPAGQYRTLVDHRSGTPAADDWYSRTGRTDPNSFDRGTRPGSNYRNYIGNGLDYQVLNREPRDSDPLGTWNTAPDGRGRWQWCDSAFQTGVWIDLPAKHGFVIIPTLMTGRVWYQMSTIQRDGLTAEFQVFDPNHFGEVLQGGRQAWDVKPVHAWVPDWRSMVPNGLAGRGSAGGPGNTACAATFDAATSRLYVRWTFAAGQWPYPQDRILVWQVA